ncbi:MAG TPA: Cu(I)-responsive transcriptional regulator [Limnobacter sp.]|uniref:Cu(I)-responsive transcriptional regulator n=1 Tax=Limnobacter sp. TaxID=2003368 RepID=UPI002ED7B20E
MNIGEASKHTGISAKMIRYYESIGLIGEANRTFSGYRQYNERDVQTLRFIRRSRDLGFSIDRIKTLLALWQDQGRKSADVKKLAQQYIAELDADIEKLQSIRQQLQHLQHCCHGDNRPDCPILDELGAVGARGGKTSA